MAKIWVVFPPEFMGVHYPVIAESLEDDLGPHPGIDKPSTERPCRQCGEKALADGSVVPKNQQGISQHLSTPEIPYSDIFWKMNIQKKNSYFALNYRVPGFKPIASHRIT